MYICSKEKCPKRIGKRKTTDAVQFGFACTECRRPILEKKNGRPKALKFLFFILPILGMGFFYLNSNNLLPKWNIGDFEIPKFKYKETKKSDAINIKLLDVLLLAKRKEIMLMTSNKIGGKEIETIENRILELEKERNALKNNNILNPEKGFRFSNILTNRTYFESHRLNKVHSSQDIFHAIAHFVLFNSTSKDKGRKTLMNLRSQIEAEFSETEIKVINEKLRSKIQNSEPTDFFEIKDLIDIDKVMVIEI